METELLVQGSRGFLSGGLLSENRSLSAKLVAFLILLGPLTRMVVFTFIDLNNSLIRAKWSVFEFRSKDPENGPY